jgi:type IV pilus assembly protein PilC
MAEQKTPGANNAGPSQAIRWFYTARNAAGEIVQGSVRADSELDAARRLQKNGYAPISISNKPKLSAQALNFNIEKRQKIKSKDLALFCRQFATMLDAGMPIIRSLKSVGDQSDHKQFKKVLPQVSSDLETGTSLAAAFGRHKKDFPDLMIAMISSGEIAGTMPETLDELALTYEKEAKMKSKIISALTYPVIVLGLAFIMITGMLIFVVPTFSNIFEQLGAELPMPTQILISVADAAKIFIPLLIIALIFGTAWWRRNKLQPNVRKITDILKTKAPVLGPFFKKVAIARFSRSMASLTDTGVPIMQTLEIVGRTSGSVLIEEALREVRESVRTGQPMSTTLATYDIFPPILIQMVSTGEETGALPGMLKKVAEYYEREVDSGSEALGSLIEPILLVFLAVIIGGMVLALYLPIFSIFETIAQ